MEEEEEEECRPVKRGRGKFSRAPRHLGGPASAQHTEKSVPDVVFLASNMRKIHFRPGLCPGPRWGAYDAPRPPSRMERAMPSPHIPLSLGAFGVSISAS